MFIRKVMLCFVAIAMLGSMSARAQQSDSEDGGQFRFRFVGPRVGNRIAAVAGVPGDASTYYAGAASGGIWKSTDGGNHWMPIFDKEPVAAIGALAVAPSDPSTVWAGTGEAWAIRDSDVMGNGIYKSTDAGKTWTNMGLPESRPHRPHRRPPHESRHCFCLRSGTHYRTATGARRLPHDGRRPTLGAGPIRRRKCWLLRPVHGSAQSAHVFAGMWQVEMHTWGEFSGGPGSGVYVSRDGGTKWTRIEEHGLPHCPLGKIDVAVAPTNSNRVYRPDPDQRPGLRLAIRRRGRSLEGRELSAGLDWTRRLLHSACRFAGKRQRSSGGQQFVPPVAGWRARIFKKFRWGGDTHDIWFDPTNADRFVITDDARHEYHDRARPRFSPRHLPIGQMYHVDVDNQIPYYFYSNMQDDGNMRGPSRSRRSSGETGWDHEMGGCESGFTVPDYADPNIVWATCYGDEVTRWDARTKHARSVSPWMHTLDSPPNDIKYRCHWTPPLAIDPFDHNTVYYGCQVIFKTTNGGQSWTVISPDLSTQDPSRIVAFGRNRRRQSWPVLWRSRFRHRSL